jgi:hypothetical protein
LPFQEPSASAKAADRYYQVAAALQLTADISAKETDDDADGVPKTNCSRKKFMVGKYGNN